MAGRSHIPLLTAPASRVIRAKAAQHRLPKHAFAAAETRGRPVFRCALFGALLDTPRIMPFAGGNPMNLDPCVAAASRAFTLCVLFAGLSTRTSAQCQPQWRIGDQQGLPGANAIVQALGLGDPDGAGPLPTCLIATGNFTFIGDARTYSAAYWNPTAVSGSGWVAMGRTDLSSGTNIYTVSNWSNRIVIGGSIGGINSPWLPGPAPTSVGAWDGSKWVPLATSDISATCQSLAVVPDGGSGILYAMGRDPSPPATRVLYRYTPGATLSTGSWTPLLADVAGTSNQLVVFNNSVYIIGRFNRTATPSVRFQVARFDPVANDVVPLPSLGANSVAAGAIVYQNELYVYGSFASGAGAPANRIIKLNGAGDAWVASSTTPTTLFDSVGSVLSAAVLSNQLFVGTDLGTRPLVKLDAPNGVWSAPPITTSQSNSVQAMAVSPDGTRLALGGTGSFDYTGSSARRFAFYDPANNTYSPAAKGLGDSGLGYPFVNGSGVIGSDLYLGGSFNGIGATGAINLAKWNGTTLSPAPGAPTSGIDKVWTDPAGDALFFNVSSTLRRYDGVSTSSPIADNTGGSYASSVFGTNALTRYQGSLVIGGSFSGSGGKPSYLMRRTGTIANGSWERIGPSDPSSTVTAITAWSHPSIAGGAPLLVATGSFATVGALTARVAAWDGTTWRALGESSFGAGYSANPAVALPILNGDLHMVVYANGINGNFNNYPVLIRYNPVTDLWVEIPRPAAGPNPIVSGFGTPVSAVSAFGSIWINTTNFNISGTTDPASVLRWDGTKWTTFGGIASLFPQSTSVNAYGTDIVLTGLFGVVGTAVPPPGQGTAGIGGVGSVGWARLDTAGGLPSIATQPANDSSCVFGSSSFTALGTSNNPPLSYQWQWREVGAPTFQPVLAGANARFAAANVNQATVNISNIQKGPNLEFRALVSDACSGPGNGPLTDPATLTLCLADFNCDGLVDDADFQIFVFSYNLLDCNDPAMPVGCAADLNFDTIVEDQDFQIFLVAYNALVCD